MVVGGIDVLAVAWNLVPQGGADRVASLVARFLNDYSGFTAQYGWHAALFRFKHAKMINNHTYIRRVVDEAKRRGLPVISTVHGIPTAPEYYACQGYTLRNSDVVVTVNKWLKNFVVDTYGVDNVVVINNGVPTHLIKRHGIVRRDFEVVGYHGRITKKKGVDKLIEAVRLIREEYLRDVRLYLLGWRSREIRLNYRWIRYYRPTVRDKEIAEFIDNLDLEVMPTQEDQQPLTALEALVRGKRVLISKLESLEELDGFVEWMDVDCSPECIADKIMEILDKEDKDEDKRTKKAIEQFGIERMIRDYAEVFQKYTHTF
ncbi:MAG: glycosyltransferase family 4 protein [Crenarchaeota archaeon]|nr:glycosyltransferase family 4 protein [Thermoproteota archaeon]